jgi:CrcB protein
MLWNVLYVLLGAMFGALARFLITHFSSELSNHHGFPYGTLIVNVAGCAMVGCVLASSAGHHHDRWRLLLATGLCGAFATFSAFAFESVAYLSAGKMGAFAFNVLVNNVMSLLAVVAGMRLHPR